jgi:quinol monooxygenase YgiN
MYNYIWKGSAVLVIKKENLNDFKIAVAKIIVPTREEKACISYDGYQVIGENGVATNRFEFHEMWKSKEAMMIDHKENSPHMQNFFKEIKADTEESFLESFEVDGKYVSYL